MTDTLIPPSSTHILLSFEKELQTLNELALQMTNLVLYQMELTIDSLAEENQDAALEVVAQTSTVNKLSAEIDDEILKVLALYKPVADDLRTVISISKISGELEKINYEIGEISKLVISLCDPRMSGVRLNLTPDIIEIGECIEAMLKKLVLSCWNRQTTPAYALLEISRDCEEDLQLSIKKQLSATIINAQMVTRTVEIIEILKSLDHCVDYCRHIANFIIFMLDGKNLNDRN